MRISLRKWLIVAAIGAGMYVGGLIVACVVSVPLGLSIALLAIPIMVGAAFLNGASR